MGTHLPILCVHSHPACSMPADSLCASKTDGSKENSFLWNWYESHTSTLPPPPTPWEMALWPLFKPIVEQKASAALSLLRITFFVLKHELPTCWSEAQGGKCLHVAPQTCCLPGGSGQSSALCSSGMRLRAGKINCSQEGVTQVHFQTY